MSDYEKVKTLHDYVVSHADYDYYYYDSDLLLDGHGVCQAYAGVMDILLHTVGIRSEYNYGTDHVWNLVEMDGEWYNIDATWDDNYDGDYETHEGGTWNYKYFGVTTEALTESDSTYIHECWTPQEDGTPYPIIATGYKDSYAYQAGLLDTRLASAGADIQAQLDAGNTSFVVQPQDWDNWFRLSETQSEYSSTELPNYTAVAALRDGEWTLNGQQIHPEISYDEATWALTVRVCPRITSFTCADSPAEGGGAVGTWTAVSDGAIGDVTYTFRLYKGGVLLDTVTSASPVYTHTFTEKADYSVSVTATDSATGTSSPVSAALDLDSIVPRITDFTLNKTDLFADEDLSVSAIVANDYFGDFTGKIFIDNKYVYGLGSDLTGSVDYLGWQFGTDENREHTVFVRFETPRGKTAVSLTKTFRLYGGPEQWFTLNGNRYYLDDESKRTTGFSEIGGHTYFFGDDGIMKTGWQRIYGGRYYFSDSGAAYTGWKTLDGYKYYFSNLGQAYADKTYRISGKSCTFDAKGRLKAPITKIRLSEKSVILVKGSSATLTPTFSPSYAYNTKVSWSSSNKKIATVSSKGVITAKKAGTVTVTCKAKDGSGKTAVCTVTVLNPVDQITLSKASVTLKKKKTLSLSATVSPSNATQKVTWASSNPKVATVSSSGTVTALKKGTCVITCSATDGSGVIAECRIRVK